MGIVSPSTTSCIMILKLRASLLSLPLLVVNAKRSQVMHSSGRRRHEARLAKQALAKTGQVFAKTDIQEHDSASFGGDSSCEQHGGGCWTDSSCCGDMECLGIVNWECGNTPGHVGEYCNLAYPCDPDLACFEGLCTDYADILDVGEYEGTCKEGSPSGQLTVMTYNTFLLSCASGLSVISTELDIACQRPDDQDERIGRMMEWVQTRDEDVIVFQELFNLREKVTAGMVAAGFCHYVVTPFGDDGDGSATFSKHPMGEVDFWDYYDFTGEDSERIPAQVEALVTDRGIMYAEVLKDGQSNHIYNTHTLSNSLTEEHLRRMGQYTAMREVSEGKSASDLVLFAGDMNEDKYNHEVQDEYYLNMLRELDATEPRQEGDQQFSYDNVKNPLPATWYPPEEQVYEELLDYVLVSNAHRQPFDSSCSILKPVWPEGCGESIACQVSDHFPVTCTYTTWQLRPPTRQPPTRQRHSFDGSNVAVE